MYLCTAVAQLGGTRTPRKNAPENKLGLGRINGEVQQMALGIPGDIPTESYFQAYNKGQIITSLLLQDKLNKMLKLYEQESTNRSC